MNWGAYYIRLREVATSYKLPVYEDGQTIDVAEIGRVSLKVQQARDWLADAYAHAQQHLAESKRKLIHVEHERKLKYNLNVAVNKQVIKLKTREQRSAMANAMCSDLDSQIADLKSVISDWEAAVLTVDQYLKAVETTKVTLGRIQRMAIAELDNLRQ